MPNNQRMPLDIQLFAENNEGTQTPAVATGTNATPQNTTVVQSNIDYDKIQGMIDSRNQKTEDSV